MRFLANENFPGAAVAMLESTGHDVVWHRTAAPGAGDPEVLAWAARGARILLTFDKDFWRTGSSVDAAGNMRRRVVPDPGTESE